MAIDHHREIRNFVREYEVACIPWSKIHLTYIKDECCETESAKSTECLLVRCTFLIVVMDSVEVVISCLRIFIIRIFLLWCWDLVAHIFFIRACNFCKSSAMTHWGVCPGLELYSARDFTPIEALLRQGLYSTWVSTRLETPLILELHRGSTRPETPLVLELHRGSTRPGAPLGQGLYSDWD